MVVSDFFGDNFDERLSDEQLKQIWPRITQENRRNIVLVSAAFFLMMAILVLLSIVAVRLQRAIPFHLFMMACSVCMIVVVKRIPPTNQKAIGFLVYVLISMLLLYSTIYGTIFNADQVATAYPAFVLASPMLFTDKRRRIFTCIAIHTAFFVVMAFAFDYKAHVLYDIINSCLFAAVSVGINSYILNVKLQQEYAQLRLAELSAKDLLTGTKNRNSYEQEISAYPASCERNLVCVYADLNGLHELNEKTGHESGDVMLKCLGNAMIAAFGEKDTYRIGGDEFVSFACDIDAKQVLAKVHSVRCMTEERSCHVSLGVAEAKVPGIDMIDLVKHAERQMYGDKRRYYEREGKDRRGRDAEELLN